MRNIATIKGRILEYLDYKSISKYECYQKTGITNGVLSKKEGLSEDNLLRFISYYSDVNIDWLLTGKGEMLKKDEKKLENFSEKNVHPTCPSNYVHPTTDLSTQYVHPKQYDANDGCTYDFSDDKANDQEQIDTLNEFIKGLQQAINQKNELLAAKEELLRSKDETIVMQKDALRLLESQINAVTGLVEKLTEYMGTDTKKRPERADTRNASDVVAP